MKGENKKDCFVNYFALAIKKKKNTSLQYTNLICNVRLAQFRSLTLITKSFVYNDMYNTQNIS